MNDAWTACSGGQFHERMGDGTPRAYEFAWNEDTLVANPVWRGILTSATETAPGDMNTPGQADAAGCLQLALKKKTATREDLGGGERPV